MARTKRRPSQSSQQRRSAQETTGTTPQNKQSQEQRAAQRVETSRAAARAQAATHGPRYRQRKSNLNPWVLVGSVVVAIAVVVGIFVYIANQSSSSTTSSKPTETAVLQAINKVDPTVLDAVNTGGLKNPITAAPGTAAKLLGPTGKPEIFYEGAEYCPYCAAERWSVATALSRFGQFSKLPETTSTGADVYPNTATLSFYGSAYSSQYIDFVSVEETTNQSDGNGGYVTLQTPTPDELQIIQKYNTSSSIPFMSIGNQYLEQGPAYIPDVLTGLSQKDIASKLSDPNSTVAKNILGGANYLTAALCAITNNQPAAVCTSATIQQIEQSLPKIQGVVQSSGALAGPSALITRRED